MISRFLEGILMEYIDMKCSLDSKLQIDYTCSVKTPSRNRDIIEKPMQLVSNPYVWCVPSGILWRVSANAVNHPTATSLCVSASNRICAWRSSSHSLTGAWLFSGNSTSDIVSPLFNRIFTTFFALRGGLHNCTANLNDKSRRISFRGRKIRVFYQWNETISYTKDLT